MRRHQFAVWYCTCVYGVNADCGIVSNVSLSSWLLIYCDGKIHIHHSLAMALWQNCVIHWKFILHMTKFRYNRFPFITISLTRTHTRTSHTHSIAQAVSQNFGRTFYLNELLSFYIRCVDFSVYAFLLVTLQSACRRNFNDNNNLNSTNPGLIAIRMINSMDKR